MEKVKIGTPFTPSGKKALLCGSGELGKEVAIELQRYGVEVVAVDKYADAPAMQVAHRSYVLPMTDGERLREVIVKEKPDYIIPEVEAIATPVLVELEREGYNVIPTARAALLTMNRRGIRTLAAEELGLPTSPYRFADTREEFDAAIAAIGLPCVVKPIMSSSGHGQSVVRSAGEADGAWRYAQEGGRVGGCGVIVEGFVRFDYEITLLTVRHSGGTAFLEPIGHHQVDGDYRESWQPQPMSDKALAKARDIARKVTDALGGYGIFGVELFVAGDEVLFSEVSPRPHDTGMVTMISQDQSEFALHARAVLGLPVPSVRFYGPSASKAIVVEGDSDQIVVGNIDAALAEEDVQIRLFGKPEVCGHRRMGVILARGGSVEEALAKAERAHSKLEIEVKPRRKAGVAADLVFRRAVKGDAPAIARAITMAFGEDMTRRLCGDAGVAVFEHVVRMDNTQYSYRNTMVCESGGRVVGAICGYDGARLHELRRPVLDYLRDKCGTDIEVADETGDGEFYLDSIGVMPEMRGRGVGAKLMEYMRDEAFAEGHRRVGLLVDAENGKAEKLYERLGFRRKGEISFLGHKMYHMQCEKR